MLKQMCRLPILTAQRLYRMHPNAAMWQPSRHCCRQEPYPIPIHLPQPLASTSPPPQPHLFHLCPCPLPLSLCPSPSTSPRLPSPPLFHSLFRTTTLFLCISLSPPPSLSLPFLPSLHKVMAIRALFSLPFRLRDIKYFAITSLAAEVLMVLGLTYVYYWDFSVILKDGFQEMAIFRPERFDVGLGLMVFAFDGIALALPLVCWPRTPYFAFPSVLPSLFLYDCHCVRLCICRCVRIPSCPPVCLSVPV